MKILPLLFLAVGAVAFADDYKAEKIGSILRLSSAGQTICDYQMAAGDVPDGVSAVFKHGAHLHPIYTPSGRIVTGNHPPDHRWHRGVWMAWTKTEFGDSHPDFWNQGKGTASEKDSAKVAAEVRFAKLESSWGNADSCGFLSEHHFLDHSIRPETLVLNEQWRVSVSKVEAGGIRAHVVDLVSTQRCAGETPLKLPKYHYGGLGVRGNAAWDPVEAVTMLTSEGHDRIKGDATKARWVYIGGEVDGMTSGLAVLIHPANFRFPQPLRLNPKNPQLCIAPSQGGDWEITPAAPYISKYRLLAFDGAPRAAWLEERWEEYSRAR